MAMVLTIWASAAPGADVNGNNSGQSYVVFGSATGFPVSLELSSLNGDNGFIINGSCAGGASQILGAAGDVNGDGVGDILLGSFPTFRHRLGAVHVLFGDTDGFDPIVELSSLNGQTGFSLIGLQQDNYSSISASGAGDVNGDGFDDLILGEPGADPNGASSGQIYLIFGKSDGFVQSTSVSTLVDSNSIIFNGMGIFDFAGDSVSAAGDVNGDGYDDVIIGATEAEPGDSVTEKGKR